MGVSSISLADKLQRNIQLLSSDVVGETVMMDMESGSYFALTGSGSYIWASLEAPITIGEIVHAVREEFDVSGFEDVEGTIFKFVEGLFNKGMVVAVD